MFAALAIITGRRGWRRDGSAVWRLARVALALVLVWPVAAGAQASFADGSPARRRITLGQALELALSRNRSLRSANLESSAAAARVAVARAALLPRLDGLENYSNTNNPPLVFSNLLAQQEFRASDFALQSLNFPGAFSNFQSQVMLTQTLFEGGRLWAALHAAGDQRAIAAYRAARTRQQVENEVVASYYGGVLAEEQTAVIARGLAAARAHRREARDLFKHGMALRSDVLRTEVLVGGLEQAQTQADGRLRVAWASLAHVLGAEDQALAPLAADQALRRWPQGQPEPLSTLVSQAVAQRPELAIAHSGIDAARQAIRIARADYLPAINVSACYENDSEYFKRAGNSYTVFVTGRINLFNGLATHSRLEATRLELERARVLRDDLVHAIGLEVESAYRNLKAALANLGVAEHDRRYADSAMRILEDRYRSGLATNVEVLDAQSARSETDMRLAQARVEVVVDRAALNLAEGLAPAQGLGP